MDRFVPRIMQSFLSVLAVMFVLSTSVRADDAATIYKAKCAGCHGADGAGNTPAAKTLGVRDFHSAEVEKETEAEFTEIIAKGKNKMPKYAEKLSEAEIKELATYARTLGKKK